MIVKPSAHGAEDQEPRHCAAAKPLEASSCRTKPTAHDIEIFPFWPHHLEPEHSPLIRLRNSIRQKAANMNGEDPSDRPDYITTVINGLERYNPEAVGTLETYLQEQCDQKTCDCNANRTLLKL